MKFETIFRTLENGTPEIYDFAEEDNLIEAIDTALNHLELEKFDDTYGGSLVTSVNDSGEHSVVIRFTAYGNAVVLEHIPEHILKKLKVALRNIAKKHHSDHTYDVITF